MAQQPRLRRQSTQAYLEALEKKDASLEMLTEVPRFEDARITELESRLKSQGQLEFDALWGEITGFYFFKLFLISEYEAPKALFVKDTEAYRSMRYESARKRVARVLYERFVAQETSQKKRMDIPPNMEFSSTFDIIAKWDRDKKDAEDEAKAAEMADPRAPEFTLSSPPDKDTSGAGGGFAQDGATNPIGVYGAPVQQVHDTIAADKAPNDLFDEVYEEVLSDLKLDVYPRFLKSRFYRQYVRTKFMENKNVSIKDFTTFRILGRGGFGAVHACKKNNSGAIYAVKFISKKLVKAKNALPNIIDELTVLKLIHSKFVSHLKYAFQDDEYIYLVIDLLLGGDLKFHLIEEGRFSEDRTRLYGAEILLALEHLHSIGIIYRDLKLENVILDDKGHAKLVDLGLAVVAKGEKIKGYAGTPGYCAPEMVANHAYGVTVDVFSFGVLLYRMLRGGKPFNGRSADDLDRAVLRTAPKFPKDVFSPVAISLLKNVMRKKPEHRLGCGPRGLEEIKEHEFFAPIDWGLLEAGYVDPVFVPKKNEVHSASTAEIGDFDLEKMAHIQLEPRFLAALKQFDYVSPIAVQDELVQASTVCVVRMVVVANLRIQVLGKAYNSVNLEKFSSSENLAAEAVKGKAKGDKEKKDKPCTIS